MSYPLRDCVTTGSSLAAAMMDSHTACKNAWSRGEMTCRVVCPAYLLALIHV
jgi:hypothetical protein